MIIVNSSSYVTYSSSLTCRYVTVNTYRRYPEAEREWRRYATSDATHSVHQTAIRTAGARVVVDGAASMQTPEMKWWPAGVFSSATSYQHGTAPVQYLTRRGPVLFAAQWRGKSASAKPTIILYRTGFRLFVSERTVVPAEPPFTARKFASQSVELASALWTWRWCCSVVAVEYRYCSTPCAFSLLYCLVASSLHIALSLLLSSQSQ